MRRKYERGRWSVTLDHKPRTSLWGRFGGGWNWKVGLQVGGTTAILSLLTFSVIVRRARDTTP